MEVSCWFRVQATSPPGKYPLVLIGDWVSHSAASLDVVGGVGSSYLCWELNPGHQIKSLA